MTDKRPLNSLFVGYQTSDARVRSIVVPMSKNCHPAIKVNNGRERPEWLSTSPIQANAQQVSNKNPGQWES